MSNKPALAFQPAPRPQPRVTPEETRLLQEATQDLGFGRKTSAPEPTPAPTAAIVEPRPTERQVAPRARQVASRSRAAAPSGASREALDRRGPALKFDIPEEVWDELRIEALKRRVTVKYLVMEALAAKGYGIDLSEVPEDGRRLR